MLYRARQGDIVWLDLDPQSGHEQKGRRPVLIVSNNTFNNFTKTAAMICPVTNTDKGLAIQVRLDNSTTTSGVIMCEQAKVLDMQKRNAVFIEKVPDYVMLEVSDILSGIIEIEE